MIFRYTEDERAEIARVAPQPLTAADFEELERFAANCPPLMISVKQTEQINQMRKDLIPKVKQISREPECYCHWSPEISRLIRSLAEDSIPKGLRKKRSNSERPDVVDEYLFSFVRYFTSRGGLPGKARTSPCVRFVIAVAGPALRMAGWAVTSASVASLIRARAGTLHRLFGEGFTTSAPEMGISALDIRSPNRGGM